MERKYKYILILLVSLCLCGCDTPTSKSKKAAFEMEVGNLAKIQTVKYADTTYFKSSKIIKLETTDENLIGEIAQIELYDNKFYILDKSLSISNLFIFDLDGRYLTKVGAVGEGPKEYLNISSFFIDEEKGVVNVIDGLASTVIQYDKKGTFLDKVKHTNPHLNFVVKAKVVDDSVFCYSKTNWEGNNMYFTINKNDFSIIKKLRKYAGEYTNHFMINFCMHPFTYVNGEFHFGGLFTDTIFSLKNHTIIPYAIARGLENIDSHKLQQELEEDEYYYGKTMERIARGNKYNTGTFNYFENRRYILRDFAIAENLLGATLWDKKENRGVYISRYLQHYGPELSLFFSTSGDTIIQVWNNRAIDMFKDEVDKKSIVINDYPSEVIDYLRSHNTEEDNPLLILHEFKDN